MYMGSILYSFCLSLTMSTIVSSTCIPFISSVLNYLLETGTIGLFPGHVPPSELCPFYCLLNTVWKQRDVEVPNIFISDENIFIPIETTVFKPQINLLVYHFLGLVEVEPQIQQERKKCQTRPNTETFMILARNSINLTIHNPGTNQVWSHHTIMYLFILFVLLV